MGIPWANIDRSGDDLSTIPGMIQPIEKQMLFWAGRDYYSGFGEIVELGTFLGTSTECLSKGLGENQRVPDKDGRIHCYDLFLRSENVDRAYAPWLDPYNIGLNGSFLPVVEHSLQAYRSFLQINAGDIMRQTWIGRPIEVLFIDMAVSWTVSDQIIRRFFPALMPGKSLIIHQDYCYQLAPWLSITMEYFADYFDIIANADSSMAFQLKRPIPDNLLQRGTECLVPQHKMALHDRAVRRFGGLAQPMGALIALHGGALFALLGDRGQAERIVHDILAANQHPVVHYRGQQLLQTLPEPLWRA